MRKKLSCLLALGLMLQLGGCAKEPVKDPVVDEPQTPELTPEELFWENFIEDMKKAEQDAQGVIDLAEVEVEILTMPASAMKAIANSKVKSITFKSNDKEMVITPSSALTGDEKYGMDYLFDKFKPVVEQPEAPTQPEEKPEVPVAPGPVVPTVVDVNTLMQAVLENTNYELPQAMMELDAETLNTLYGISSEDVYSFSVNVPMMNVQATELAFFYVKEGKMDVVKSGVAARLASLEATWSQYLPAQYELVQNAQIYENGNFYFMVISDFASDIMSEIQANFN